MTTAIVTTARVTENPLREDRPWPPAPSAVADFHRRMPGYEPKPVIDAPTLADDLGLGRLLIKSETSRLGLPSFKILGASWAVYRTICDHLGDELESWETIDDLARQVERLKPLKLVAATDGNHGRAVAFMARLLGLESEIFVPAGMATARIRSMEDEGAVVTVVDGDYDDAVVRSGHEAGSRCLVISDTSWPGYEAVPNRVVEGYSTIFAEVDHSLAIDGLPQPDLVVVPMGVGALMAAAITHYRTPTRAPIIVGVEPLDANCIQQSAAAGTPTHVSGPHRSIMVGLNCGRPSPVAWPRVSTGVDRFASVGDDAARRAMRDLGDAGVVAGETGAASLAGLRAVLSDQSTRVALGDLAGKTALILVTEGATDPAAYREIVGLAGSAH